MENKICTQCNIEKHLNIYKRNLFQTTKKELCY